MEGEEDSQPDSDRRDDAAGRRPRTKIERHAAALRICHNTAAKVTPQARSYSRRRLSGSDTTPPPREEVVFPIAATWITRQQQAATARKIPVQPIRAPRGRYPRRRRPKARYATTPPPLEGAAKADRRKLKAN